MNQGDVRAVQECKLHRQFVDFHMLLIEIEFMKITRVLTIIRRDEQTAQNSIAKIKDQVFQGTVGHVTNYTQVNQLGKHFIRPCMKKCLHRQFKTLQPSLPPPISPFVFAQFTYDFSLTFKKEREITECSVCFNGLFLKGTQQSVRT